MGISWAFRLLPYLEEQAIHDAYDSGFRVDADENATAMRNPVAVYYCPSRRQAVADRNFDNNNNPPAVTGVAAGGDFAANAGVHFMFQETENIDRAQAGPIYTFSRIRLRQVTDGASKTFAIGERHIPPVDASVPADMTHFQQGDCAFFAADTPWGIFADTRRGLADSRRDHSRDKYGGEHPGITMFVFLDGHVMPVDNGTDLEVLNWFCAIGDGNDPTTGIDYDGGET